MAEEFPRKVSMTEDSTSQKAHQTLLVIHGRVCSGLTLDCRGPGPLCCLWMCLESPSTQHAAEQHYKWSANRTWTLKFRLAFIGMSRTPKYLNPNPRPDQQRSQADCWNDNTQLEFTESPEKGWRTTFSSINCCVSELNCQFGKKWRKKQQLVFGTMLIFQVNSVTRR